MLINSLTLELLGVVSLDLLALIKLAYASFNSFLRIFIFLPLLEKLDFSFDFDVFIRSWLIIGILCFCFCFCCFNRLYNSPCRTSMPLFKSLRCSSWKAGPVLRESKLILQHGKSKVPSKQYTKGLGQSSQPILTEISNEKTKQLWWWELVTLDLIRLQMTKVNRIKMEFEALTCIDPRSKVVRATRIQDKTS